MEKEHQIVKKILTEYGIGDPSLNIGTELNKAFDFGRSEVGYETFEIKSFGNLFNDWRKKHVIRVENPEVFEKKMGLEEKWRGKPEWLKKMFQIRMDLGSEKLFMQLYTMDELYQKIVEGLKIDDTYFLDKMEEEERKKYQMETMFQKLGENSPVKDLVLKTYFGMQADISSEEKFQEIVRILKIALYKCYEQKTARKK